MNHSLVRLTVVCAACLPGIMNCSASPKVLDFYAVQSADEQRAMGEYYRTEAAMFWQRANEMTERVTAYRQLFGEDSEWVSGARLLGEYYQQEARERERLAERYQSFSGEPTAPAPSPHENRAFPK